MIESMDWTPDFTVGHLMEAVIQLHENDKKMFDSLIECDFISATNDLVMEAEEAEKENKAGNDTKIKTIGQKISDVLSAISKAIQKAAANFIAKITDLVKADKKIYETYKDVITIDALKDFKGIADFSFPKEMITSESIKSAENSSKFTAEFNSKVAKAEDREVIDSAYKEFEEKVKKEEESYNKLKEESFQDKVDFWKPTEQWQIKKMLESVSSASKTIKDIKTVATASIKALKLIQSDAKKAQFSFASKKGAEEIEVYKMKKLYDVASQNAKLHSKEFNTYTNVAAKQIAACRKAVILCGRYAKKGSKAEETATDTKGKSAKDDDVEVLHGEVVDDFKESMIMYALGESSDEYVFECLGY
jgi:hypothetical protein